MIITINKIIISKTYVMCMIQEDAKYDIIIKDIGDSNSQNIIDTLLEIFCGSGRIKISKDLLLDYLIQDFDRLCDHALIPLPIDLLSLLKS